MTVGVASLTLIKIVAFNFARFNLVACASTSIVYKNVIHSN